MNIKAELFIDSIADIVRSRLNFIDIDDDEIVDTMAVKALLEIKEVLHNENLSDFEIVDEIVTIFNKYKIDSGSCHGF